MRARPTRVGPARLSQQRVAGVTREELFQGDACLEPGQCRSEAMVDAAPESQMPLHAARDVEAIRIGTLNAAAFLGKERELGSIEEGKLADLVLLNSDPLADISNAQDIAMVIKAGVVVDRGALDLPVNRR